jgi:hypothetical protein
MKNFSDFRGIGYNKKMCEHVYNNLGPGPCGKCGLATHDINWAQQNKKHEEYREKVGYFYNVDGWWSI